MELNSRMPSWRWRIGQCGGKKPTRVVSEVKYAVSSIEENKFFLYSYPGDFSMQSRFRDTEMKQREAVSHT